MQKDIEDSKDIKKLVDLFYQKVNKNDLLAYVFNDIMKINWQEHLPQMYKFWGSILLGQKSFIGNPATTHIMVNQQHCLTEEHFDQWLELWQQTLIENFVGEKATEAYQRSLKMRRFLLDNIRASEK